MAGIELMSDQGFRIDGRKAHELRQIRCKLGVFSQADGSAYLEQGNTKILATVYGPHEVSTQLSLCCDKAVSVSRRFKRPCMLFIISKVLLFLLFNITSLSFPPYKILV